MTKTAGPESEIISNFEQRIECFGSRSEPHFGRLVKPVMACIEFSESFRQSRGLLEYCVRQCALKLPNLKFEGNSAVQGLIYENAQVHGVRFTRDGAADSLAADLVVDAGGRGMPLGAAWGREGVVRSLVLGGSGVTNPLPSTT